MDFNKDLLQNKSLAEIYNDQNNIYTDFNSIYSNNKDFIDNFLKDNYEILNYKILNEQELHNKFTDIYVYIDDKEQTFKLFGTLKKEADRKKGKTVLIFNFGKRLKKEFFNKYTSSTGAMTKDYIYKFVTFSYMVNMQKKFNDIKELGELLEAEEIKIASI